MSMKMLAMDTETFLITREKPLPKIVCCSFADGPGDAEVVKRENLQPIFEALLADPDIHFVGCNIAYDFGVLASTFPQLLPAIFNAYQSKRITDVAIRQQLFDIATGRTFAKDKIKHYSLAILTKLLLEIDMEGKTGEDIWRLRYAEIDDVPLEKWPKEALDYSKLDSIYVWEIWREQEEGTDVIVDDYEQAYAAFVFGLMTARGMRTDSVAVAECRALHEKTMEELRPLLIENGLVTLEGTKKKPKWVKKQKPARDRIVAACEKVGVKPLLTDKKAISIDKAACVWSRDELMLTRAKYVTAEKMVTTYIPALEEGIEGPITSKIQLAATGRTTSAGPSEPLKGTNLQNAPRLGKVRECFRARHGYLYMAADLAGAELHTLAQSCKNELEYSVLGETLNSGKDVHLWLAAHLLNIPYAEASERLEAKDPAVKDARQDAKPANFGFPGGMGPDTFILTQLRQRLRLWERDRVVKLRDAWLRAFPEMEEFFALAKFQLGPDRRADIPVYSSGRIRRVRSFPMCCNSKFQSPAADGAKRGLCEVSRRCYTEPDSALWGSYPCNFVHDENILEVPDQKEIYQPAAVEFVAVMEQEFNSIVPDYPTTVEAVLMKHWTKKAEPVYDSAGGLVPWVPDQ